MNPFELEDSIIARLAPLVDQGVVVIPTPESDGQFKRATKARVVVVYAGLRPQDRRGIPVDSMGPTMQYMEVLVDVTLQSPKLRSDSGIYSLHRAVMALLVGFQPAHARKMYVDSVRPQIEDNDWSYTITFAAPTVILEVSEEDIAPYCRAIKFIDNDGDELFTLPKPPDTDP